MGDLLSFIHLRSRWWRISLTDLEAPSDDVGSLAIVHSITLLVIDGEDVICTVGPSDINRERG